MADVAAPAAADNGRASPLRADLERPPPADARPLRAPPRDATAPVSAPLGRQAEEPGAPARGQPERGAGGGEQERSPQRQRAPVAHERPGSRPGRDNAAGEPPGGQAEEGTSGEGKGDRGPERHRSGPRAEGRTSREGHAQERARPALQERQVVSGRAPRAEVCSASTCHRPHFANRLRKKVRKEAFRPRVFLQCMCVLYERQGIGWLACTGFARQVPGCRNAYSLHVIIRE